MNHKSLKNYHMNYDKSIIFKKELLCSADKWVISLKTWPDDHSNLSDRILSLTIFADLIAFDYYHTARVLYYLFRINKEDRHFYKRKTTNSIQLIKSGQLSIC